jgi:hypothetical protein
MLKVSFIIAAGRFISEQTAAKRHENGVAARRLSACEFNPRLTSVKSGKEECPKMIMRIGTAGGNANRMRTRLVKKNLRRNRFAR